MQDAQARGKDPFAAAGSVRNSHRKGKERAGSLWDDSDGEAGEEDARFDA